MRIFGLVELTSPTAPADVRAKCLAENAELLRARLPYGAAIIVLTGAAGWALEHLAGAQPTTAHALLYSTQLLTVLATVAFARLYRDADPLHITRRATMILLLLPVAYYVAISGSAGALRLVQICYLVGAMILFPWGAGAQSALVGVSLGAFTAALATGIPTTLQATANIAGLAFVGGLTIWGAALAQRHRLTLTYRRQMNDALMELASQRALVSGDLGAAAREVTEVAARTLGASSCRVLLQEAERYGLQRLESHVLPEAEREEGARRPATERLPNGTPDANAGTGLRRPPSASLEAVVRVRGRPGGVVRVQSDGRLRYWTLDEEHFVGSLADLIALAIEASERRRAEEELRRREADFRGIFESIQDVFYRTDVNGTVQMVSPSVETYGYSTAELVGRPVERLYADAAEREQLLAVLLRDGSVNDYEIALRRKDGGEVICSASIRLLVDEDGKPAGVEGLLRDITARKQAEAMLHSTLDELAKRSAALSHAVLTLNQENAERRKAEDELRESRAQLRALSTRLLSIQEEERARIAREIHDELGQVLTALSFDVRWLTQKLSGTTPPVDQKLAKMAALVGSTMESVQAISTNLRPPLLDDLGLAAAVRWHVREFEERTGIACVLTMDGDDLRLDSGRSTTLFRLLQEALTNVARHAHATRIQIALQEVQGRLVLRVHDNGRGIRPDEASDPSALGLAGMRERVRPWGGTLAIRGRPGRGTLLRVEIPLPPPEEMPIKETA